MVLHQIDQKRSAKKPYLPELYKFVKGPQWFDWLALNLSGSTLNLHISEKETIVEILKSIKVDITSCLSSNLYGKKHPILLFIADLKHDNLLDLYFDSLRACIKDSNSVD